MVWSAIGENPLKLPALIICSLDEYLSLKVLYPVPGLVVPSNTLILEQDANA